MLRDQTWVLTGAAGRIATGLRPDLAGQVRRLRLVDVVPVAEKYDCEEAIVADLRDPDMTQAAIAGADGVLHLGGLADEADFHDLVEVNIAGTFHALEAARRTGVKRFIYASSNRVTGMYPVTTTVNPDMPPRPDGLYGVSKVAGEALGRMYAEKFGLSVIAVRIGSAEDTPQDARQLSTWLSPADCRAAFLAAMLARDVSYAAFYAVSRNRRGWWDLSAGSRLGFHPADDAEHNAAGLERQPRSPLIRQGGAYADGASTLRWLEPTRDTGPSAAVDRAQQLRDHDGDSGHEAGRQRLVPDPPSQPPPRSSCSASASSTPGCSPTTPFPAPINRTRRAI